MTNTAYSLFAFVKDSGHLVVKVVSVDAETQSSIVQLFRDQHEVFLKGRVEVTYQAGYKVGEEEMFAVRFELPADIEEALENPDTCVELSESDIIAEAIVCLTLARKRRNSLEAMFQYVERSQILTRKRFLMLFREKTFGHPNGGGIGLSNKIDAVWSEGILRFTSEALVKRFLDLSLLFQEATDEDVEAFFESDAFAPTSLDLSKVNRGMRVRIKQVLTSKVLEKYTPEEMKSLAYKYDVKVSIKGGQIVIPVGNRELRALISFLVEDYFEGELSRGKFLSNSKRKV